MKHAKFRGYENSLTPYAHQGRIPDNFSVALAGSNILDFEEDLGKLLPVANS
jgi:hypothetical protein